MPSCETLRIQPGVPPVTQLETLIIEGYRLSGMEEDVARATAKTTLMLLHAVGIIHSDLLDRFERDAKIYRLKGEGVRTVDLAIRFSLSREAVHRMYRRHMRARRAALKSVA